MDRSEALVISVVKKFRTELPLKRTSMRIVSVGHAIFAAVMIALGISGLIEGDFASIWDAVSKDFPAREVLVYLCAVIPLACGLGLLWRRTAAAASRVLFVCLFLWMLLFKVRLLLLLAPLVEGLVLHSRCLDLRTKNDDI